METAHGNEPAVLRELGYPVPIIVTIDGIEYGCTGDWDEYDRMEHGNGTCSIHEDEASSAYVGEGLRRRPSVRYNG